jgi:hypothetical protein
MELEITVYWGVTPCSLLDTCQHFKGPVASLFSIEEAFIFWARKDVLRQVG